MSEEAKRPRGRPRKIQEIAPHTVAEVKMDDWQNALLGLGMAQDRSQYTTYNGATILDDGTLNLMYLGEGLAARVIDIVADDMTREWIYIKDDEKRDTIDDELERLDAEEVFNTAIKWQRLYRGSIILIGAMDGRAVDQPLNEDAIRNIEYLKVIDASAINMSESIFETDPMKPMYGKIIKYKVRYYVGENVVEMFIHYTRVLEFRNDPVPSTTFTGLTLSHRYWGISSLQKIYESLRDLGGVSQSTVNILYEFVSGTYKFKNLAQLIASGNEQGLAKRLQAINMSRSTINAVVLDSEEDYKKDYTSLSGLPEIIDRYMLQLSGSTGIPVTRLYGRSPAGLNATGESDTRNYYDLIEASQRNRLKPPLRRLLSLIAKWKKLDPNVKFEFNSLYQLTEEEKAKIEYTEAQTRKLDMETATGWADSGLRDMKEVADEFDYEYVELETEPTPEELASLVTPAPQDTSTNDPNRK